MSLYYMSIVPKPASTDKNALRQLAETLGLGEDVPTVHPCTISDDMFSGDAIRHIGDVFYSPLYIPKRGGPWRIAAYTDATNSDQCAILEAAITFMQRGRPTAAGWTQRKFTKAQGSYLSMGICRRLSDYDGEELFTMVSLPLDVQAAMFLGSIHEMEVSHG